VTRLRASMAVEFVMIVTGVLIALAADSALERRPSAEQARTALEALRDEIDQDVASLTDYWEPDLARQEEARSRLSSFLRDSGPIQYRELHKLGMALPAEIDNELGTR